MSVRDEQASPSRSPAEAPRSSALRGRCSTLAEVLADHTTLRLGGPAAEWGRVTTEDELIDAVRTADTQGVPTLVLAGGSNLVVADNGFDGRVVEIATTG